jgi:hypothetical protein
MSISHKQKVIRQKPMHYVGHCLRNILYVIKFQRVAYLSLYREHIMRWTTKNRGSIFGKGKRSSVYHSIQPSSEAQSTSNQELPFFTSGVNWGWNWPFTSILWCQNVELYLYSIIRLHTCLIKYRHNSILPLPDDGPTPVFMWLSVHRFQIRPITCSMTAYCRTIWKALYFIPTVAHWSSC